MKINSKILSIPPYISSSWEHISSVHLEEKEGNKVLVVLLNNGSQLEIPGLDAASIDKIFLSHAQYLEEQSMQPKSKETSPLGFGIPISISPDSLGPFLEALQDPSKIGQVEFPQDVIEKIIEFAKSMGLDENALIPEGNFPEDSIYGKLKQALTTIHQQSSSEAEEEVSDEDLRFKEWDIAQVSDKLYKVSNPLDSSEEYQVYLGNPIGCTCGKNNCEHIKAVLRS